MTDEADYLKLHSRWHVFRRAVRPSWATYLTALQRTL